MTDSTSAGPRWRDVATGEAPAGALSGHLVIEWGGSALDEVDPAFISSVLETALVASGDQRLARHPIWLLSVSLVDDTEIARLNEQFRGIAAPTDVLSFPQLDDAGQDTPGGAPHPYEAIPLVLGDIVLSLPRARSQALEYGHSLPRELGFLLVHSVLHLLGYDHEDDADRQAMRGAEERILALLSLPRDE